MPFPNKLTSEMSYSDQTTIIQRGSQAPRGTVIATAFVIDEPGSESFFPQVGGQSSTFTFQRVYWRCIACLFATSIRCNPDAQHVLFCNKEPPRSSDNLFQLLDEWGVQIVVAPFTSHDPRLHLASFGNVMYTFDAIAAANRSYPNDRLILLDADCVWLRGIDNLETAIDENNVLFYETGYTPDEAWNGLTLRELRAAATFLNRKPISVLKAAGGEFIALSPQGRAQVLERFEDLWCAVTQNPRGSIGMPVTEEHYLSLISGELTSDVETAKRTIKRIWTALKYRNVQPDDLGLVLWHLPSEKRTGFVSLFHAICDRESPFWTVPPGVEMAIYLGRHFGIPNRSLSKIAIDITDRLSARATRLFGK
jgi:hypothetical protein